MTQALTPVERLNDDHLLEDFASGEPSLDGWLKQRSQENLRAWRSTTYVVCRGRRVVGYYCLSSSSVSPDLAPAQLMGNAREMGVPTTLLGRLARDESEQGLGSDLLLDAFDRAYRQSQHIASRAIEVDALNDFALEWYLSKGFKAFVGAPSKLWIKMRTIGGLLA